MNKNLDYKYMVSLIANIHTFIDNSENLIKKMYSDHHILQNKINSAYSQEIGVITKQYNAQHEGVKKRAEKLISEAQSIYDEITKLEETLLTTDKYFVKTRAKREQELIDKYSESYNQTKDYFEILEDVKNKFQAIVVKYSNRKHKGIIDGINYVFSAKRKQDYEDLIILKNTTNKIIDEINEMVPTLTDDSLADFDKEFLIKRDSIEQKHADQIQKTESDFAANIENVAEQICNKLDSIVSDELIDELVGTIKYYDNNYGKLDAQRVQFGPFVMLGYLVYPYKDFIESKVILQLIDSKFEALINNNEIRLPITCSLGNGFSWMIDNEDITTSGVEKFIHSVMFSFLSFSPISKMKYSVVDVENRGNSILPFLEFKKKCPQMFYDKILTTQEEIRERLYNLNNYIDDFIQNKLGNKYENFYEYNVNNPNDVSPVTLLVLFDFPKGFDEVTCAELKNILKNGNKCGVFTLISYNKRNEQSGFYNSEESIGAIKTLSSSIKYEQGKFYLNNLELVSKAIPSSQDINSFADKYMLIMEGKNGDGIVFPALVKNLLKIKEEQKINQYIASMAELKKEYIASYGKIHEHNMDFPSRIMIGSTKYPTDIFSSYTVNQLTKNGFIDNMDRKSVTLPFTCDLDDKFNIIFVSNMETEDNAQKFSNVFIMNFLSSIPYGGVVFSIFDPEKRGNSIVPYLDFRKKAPDIFDSQIYTSQDSIFERLKYYNEYIDEFIQEKLDNRYANIVEYNSNISSKQELVHLLMLYDFPKGFDNRAYELLLNILKNGNKCGVYVFINYNVDITVSHYDNHEEYIDQIKKQAICVDYSNGVYTLSPYNLPITINNILTQNESQDFINAYLKIVDKQKNKGLSFDEVFEKDLFKLESANKLSIPIGVGDGDKIINLVMGEGSSHHCLIAGATGSGKSTLLHTIIMSSMLNYAPDKLNLYLMDFKSGTEFKIYESVKLPHIKLLALDAMQEFGESILENLVAEMEKRGELFKSVGQTNLKGYCENPGRSLPRILVVMDEFQILFNDSTNRKIALNCAELTKRIVTEGRAFGIHLLMATQSTKVIRDLTLQQGTIEQMRIRIGLKCGEDDARYLFSDKNDTKALEMMKGPIGTAVLNNEYIEESNIRFRAAYFNHDMQEKYLKIIAEKFKDIDSKPQIFEGNRTVNMSDYLDSINATIYESPFTKIYLGEKIKVAPPFILDIDKRKKHNVLICGSNERMNENIVNQYLLSISLNRKAIIYLFDGDMIVGDNSYQETYEAYKQLGERFILAHDRGDIITSIRSIYDVFNKKKKSNNDESIFVVIKNLQWLDIVQKMLKDESIDESEYIQEEPKEEVTTSPFDWGIDEGSSSESISSMLRKMIDEGASCGVYFVIASMEYTVVKETMHYSDNLLSKIPERIIFALSDSDADNLIDGISVSQLKDNTVYFTDGIKNIFQFKPFVINSIADVKKILKIS